jgi:hypothetical protein
MVLPMCRKIVEIFKEVNFPRLFFAQNGQFTKQYD